GVEIAEEKERALRVVRGHARVAADLGHRLHAVDVRPAEPGVDQSSARTISGSPGATTAGTTPMKSKLLKSGSRGTAASSCVRPAATRPASRCATPFT